MGVNLVPVKAQEQSLTLDQVVSENIKDLRSKRRWTATELAEKLSALLERDYTRFTVADLEGRRNREIRWSELAALCAIFDVPLNDLVLPKEGDEVTTMIATGDMSGVDLTDLPSDDPDLAAIGATKAIVWHAYPGKKELAWRFFGRGDSKAKRDKNLRQEDLLAVVDAVLPLLRERLSGRNEEE